MDELTKAFRAGLEKRGISLRALSKETEIPLTELHRMQSGKYKGLAHRLGRYAVALRALGVKARLVIGDR